MSELPRPAVPSARSLHAAAGVAVAAALTVSLAACSSAASTASDDTPAEPADVRVQFGWLPNVENGAFIDAVEKGYYEDEGLDLEILPGGPDVAVDAQIVGGGALVGLMTSESLANAVLSGAPLVGVAAVYQYSSNAIVTLADAGIDEPEDLEGRKVGLSANDRTTVPFLTWLGLDMDTVEIVAVDGSPTPLASGEVDALVSPVGNVPVVLASQGIETSTIPVADHGYNRWSSVLVVREDSLEDPEKLEQVQGVIAGTLRGVQDLLDDPAAVGSVVYDVYGEQLGLEEQTQVDGAAIWADLIERGHERSGGALMEITESGLEEQQSLYDNILGVDLQAADLYDLSVAEGILGD
jgi:NitT/TauT family transport system substrate-binding protein